MPEKIVGEYRLVVGVMSWKQQLTCTQQYNHWLYNIAGKQLPFDREISIATMLTLHAPVRLYKENQLLPSGTYTLPDGTELTLPLTEETLNALPAPLAQFLVQGAMAENMQTIANFMEGTALTRARLSELPSASGQ